MAANSENIVKKVYQAVIDEVIQNVRDQFLDEGYDDQLLQELKIWETKLNATKVFLNSTEETSARLPVTPSTTQTPQSSVISALNALPQSHVPSNVIQAAQQKQQQSTETTKSQLINIKPQIVSNQIDGIDDSSDDEEEDIVPVNDAFDDDDDDEEDELIKQADEAHDEGKEDPDPLNSSDDVSEHDPNEIFDTDNVIICQYEKLTRIKTRWKFHLKDGVMNINGKDYLFAKATGEADW